MKKVAHFRKAIWLQNANRVMQTVVQNRANNINQNVLHVFDVTDGQQCMVAAVAPHGAALFVHFVVYEAGAGAAVIETIARAGQASADVEPPPANREYIISQVFSYIRGNNLLWATHNNTLRDASIYDIFSKCIQSLGQSPFETDFQFQAQLDQAAYRQAFSRGIEEIDLGLGDLRSTLDRLTNNQRLPAMGFIDSLRSLVGHRPTQAEIQAADKVEGRLSLRPGRDWSAPHVTAMMAKLANSVVAHHTDEFTIVTKDGLRLTRDRMAVHRDFRVEGNRRILNATQVADAFSRIYGELRQARVIV